MQMVNTRRGTETSQQGAENNPPPPPQTLAEVVAQQTQILHMLAQNQMNQQQQHQARQAPPQTASYNDFAGTHPLIFAKADDPLEADSWISFMECNFELITCIDEQKDLCAAHQH